MARQFIYHMTGLTKLYGTKKVLENVHLSFYPDAKIGILGPNGAGKSTVLRIMAGMDKEWTGEAWVAEGATVGYLAQEPQLDESLNVLGNVMEGVAAKTAILERYNEVMMNYSDETAEEGAKLQDIIDSQNLWDLDSQVEMAMDALRCPPGDATIDNLSGGEKRRFRHVEPFVLLVLVLERIRDAAIGLPHAPEPVERKLPCREIVRRLVPAFRYVEPTFAEARLPAEPEDHHRLRRRLLAVGISRAIVRRSIRHFRCSERRQRRPCQEHDENTDNNASPPCPAPLQMHKNLHT